MTTQSPPSILALVSRPLVDEHKRPLDRLDLEGEIELVRERLGDLDRAVDVYVEFATTDNLMRLLIPPRDYDVLHFSGHGGDGLLAFEDRQGTAHPVTSDELRRLIGVASRPPRLVFLSACHSGSLAHDLIQAGVSHVIAIDTQASVLDLAATAFARAFYPALLAGRPLHQAFEVGLVAVATDGQLRHLGLVLEEPGLASGEEAKFMLLPTDAGHSLALFPSTLPQGKLNFHRPRTTRHNLPARPETFTGRQRELHRLIGQILDHRLVTRTGLGGMGKTALAEEAGRWLAERGQFPDGIIFVDLQELSETSGVRARIAEKAGLELSAAADDESLAHALAGHRLLILDDLDRLAATDARALADLLQALADYAAPAHLLLTTRELVGGPAQRRERLGRMEEGQAKDLFLRLAGLTHEHLHGYQRDLAAILAFLDGWPLAITLAARLLAVYGGELSQLRTQLAAAKERVLADPSIPPDRRRKEESLLVSLRLSYDRLKQSEPGAALTFAGLSLFPGGADTAAIRAILGPQHLAYLPRLRALSLAEELPGGRLRLPAPARAFAERGLPADAYDTCGPAALDYYLELASQADDMLGGAGYEGGLNALLTEQPNIEKWLDWGLAREPVKNNTSRAARLAGRLRNLYMLLDWPAHGVTYLRQGVEAAHHVGDKEGEANTLKAIGDVQQFRDERDAALDSYQQALQLFRAVGDRLGEANVLLAVAPFEEEPAQAFARAIALYEEIGDRYSVARGLYYYGLWLREQDHASEAQAILSQSRDLFLAIDLPQAAAVVEGALENANR